MMEVQKPSGFWEIMLQIKGTAFEQLCSKNNKFRMERNKKVIKDWMSSRKKIIDIENILRVARWERV